MDIKELNKTQLILLTLLITFVVSIATGIITVSLMQQIPKSVPQTINNVIQRTIEKVTTVPAELPEKPTTDTSDNKGMFTGDGDVLVSIYSKEDVALAPIPAPGNPPVVLPKALGQGIIISDMGLILVDSSILNDKEVYKVTLDKIDFDATVIKKFTNGFTILRITPKKEMTGASANSQGASALTPTVDPKQ